MTQMDDDYWLNEPARGPFAYPLSTENGEEILRIGIEISKGRPPEVISRRGPFVIDLSPETHYGPFAHAIDFLMPEGTEVLASAAGEVVKVVDHHTEGGFNEAFANSMNFVTIRHANGMFSQYCHLAPGSVSIRGVAVGTLVHAGQPIGEIGLTGWTDRPHLHFLVFRTDQRGRPTHHHTLEDITLIEARNRRYPPEQYPFKSLEVTFG